ncbi:MAG: N-formylglutamate amidohydrolase [Geminicoccaceae bacterium]
MNAKTPPLLNASDPSPFALVNAAGRARLVLTCEHGGRAVPAALASGGPPAADMDRHIAYDVGAVEVATILAERLDAPLALQPFSRLVIDCNRPRHAQDLAPDISDGSVIPFNQGLDDAARDARWQAIHQPFHQAVTGLINVRENPALLAVHSFTRQLRSKAPRAMAIGLIARQDKTFSCRLGDAITSIQPDLEIAFDAPYQIEDSSDYTIPTHGEARGLPHLLLEIRNDLIADQPGVEAMADLLARALEATLSDTESHGLSSS